MFYALNDETAEPTEDLEKTEWGITDKTEAGCFRLLKVAFFSSPILLKVAVFAGTILPNVAFFHKS